MGLFSKKYCDICGEKIGFLGNRKLEDGNICKDCAKKLSPWFDDRRHSTLQEIKDQLDYREQNRQAVAAFRPTRKVGQDMTVYVDEAAGTFLVTQADPDDWEEKNPDVISLEAVKDCTVDVRDSRRELTYEDKDGNRQSYSPARYEYSYYFKMKITVDHPFIDEIDYDLNQWALKIEYCDRSLFGLGSLDPSRDSEYRSYMSMAEEIRQLLTAGPAPRRQEPEQPEGPVYQDKDGSIQPIAHCPYCGSRCRMTDNGRCPYCGGNLEI